MCVCMCMYVCVCETCIWTGGEGGQGELCVQVLQGGGEARVAAGPSHSQGEAAQRVRTSQSGAVPTVQHLRRALVTQRTRPHLHTHTHTRAHTHTHTDFSSELI